MKCRQKYLQSSLVWPNTWKYRHASLCGVFTDSGSFYMGSFLPQVFFFGTLSQMISYYQISGLFLLLSHDRKRPERKVWSPMRDFTHSCVNVLTHILRSKPDGCWKKLAIKPTIEDLWSESICCLVKSVFYLLFGFILIYQMSCNKLKKDVILLV